MQAGLRKAVMYTQCPDCKQQQTITTEQLRSTRGMLKCTECSAMFDALQFISDQPLEESEPVNFQELFPAKPKQHIKHQNLWIVGLCTGILLLFGQFFYFEAYKLSQNQTLRPLLVNLCQSLKCQLPEYHNPAEIDILLNSLEPADKNSYTFKVAISNQAQFNQAYPKIQLSLLNFSGKAFAKRVFSADNYQPKSATLAVNETAEIKLDIAAPKTKIGGYTFKLL